MEKQHGHGLACCGISLRLATRTVYRHRYFAATAGYPTVKDIPSCKAVVLTDIMAIKIQKGRLYAPSRK